uniref:Ig-like domain-containing protein n=1 Tax=Sus scrofa TaxID=9823 RepID=A0A8D1KPF9_PIG
MAPAHLPREDPFLPRDGPQGGACAPWWGLRAGTSLLPESPEQGLAWCQQVLPPRGSQGVGPPPFLNLGWELSPSTRARWTPICMGRGSSVTAQVGTGLGAQGSVPSLRQPLGLRVLLSLVQVLPRVPLVSVSAGSLSQAVLTQPPSLSASPGASARLICTLSGGSSVGSYHISWYQQKPGSPPQYLLRFYSGSRTPGSPTASLWPKMPRPMQGFCSSLS